MKQELDVLTTTVNARQALEREEKKRCNDYEIERPLLSSKVVGDDCWQEKNSKGDTIQERSNSDFDVKCATIQFYVITRFASFGIRAWLY
jgi:hypothetical protein